MACRADVWLSVLLQDGFFYLLVKYFVQKGLTKLNIEEMVVSGRYAGECWMAHTGFRTSRILLNGDLRKVALRGMLQWLAFDFVLKGTGILQGWETSVILGYLIYALQMLMCF